MQNYASLTVAQKLALTTEQFETAVKAEAVVKGLTLPTAIEVKPLTGFSTDEKATVLLWEVKVNDGYRDNPGIMFADEATANEVAAKAVCLSRIYLNSGYEWCLGTQPAEVHGRRIFASDVEAKRRESHAAPHKALQELLHTREQVAKALTDLATECMNDLIEIKADKYNRDRLAAEWAEYIKLANGDENVAGVFWRKNKGCEPPTETAAA